MHRSFSVLSLILSLLAGSAHADDLAVVPSKLIVIESPSKAKVVLVVKDPAVTKGAGTSASTISAQVHIGYGDGTGIFVMPQGDAWKNGADKASYKNADAPAGGSVKKHGIQVGKSLKMVASSLGEIPLDISAPSDAPVTFAEVIDNAGAITRLCGQFTTCTRKTLGNGGTKLICKGTGAIDPTCAAVPTTTTTQFTTTLPPTTTTTISTTTTTLPGSTTTLAPTTTAAPSTTTTLPPTTTTLEPTTTTMPFICEPGSIRSCNTGQPGVCADGTEICHGYSWECTAHFTPSPEDCGDNRDNDCDGVTDDGCVCNPSASEGCDTGLPGPCSVGLRHCNSDGLGWGACDQQTFPSTDVCFNGEDENCDGQVDENCYVTTTTFYDGGGCEPIGCMNGGTFDPVGCRCTCYPNLSGVDCGEYDCSAGHTDPFFCSVISEEQCAFPSNAGQCPQKCLCS